MNQRIIDFLEKRCSPKDNILFAQDLAVAPEENLKLWMHILAHMVTPNDDNFIIWEHALEAALKAADMLRSGLAPSVVMEYLVSETYIVLRST